MLRNIQEEDRLWEAKDRKREKKRLQEEQEPDADGAKKFAGQGAPGDTDSGSSKSTSDVAKHPLGFY